MEDKTKEMEKIFEALFLKYYNNNFAGRKDVFNVIEECFQKAVTALVLADVDFIMLLESLEQLKNDKIYKFLSEEKRKILDNCKNSVKQVIDEEDRILNIILNSFPE